MGSAASTSAKPAKDVVLDKPMSATKRAPPCSAEIFDSLDDGGRPRRRINNNNNQSPRRLSLENRRGRTADTIAVDAGIAALFGVGIAPRPRRVDGATCHAIDADAPRSWATTASPTWRWTISATAALQRRLVSIEAKAAKMA